MSFEQKTYPEIMAGKTIMYVHGFASSAQSGTVTRFRTMLPQATTIAYDLPVDPHEAIALLKEKVEEHHPDLIVGTSMGGMYAEQLYGYDRILVNPAFEIADTMGAHGMIGKQTFQNPRQDGVQEFIVTKAMVKEYRAVQEQCFTQVTKEEQQRVWGLFGDADPLVHTMPLFKRHYTQAISFHGEHRMDDSIFINSIIPVIRWIDDKQEGRERPIVYISVEALCDMQGRQLSSARKGFRYLLEHYNLYIVAEAPDYETDEMRRVQEAMRDIINVPAYHHLIFTQRKDLLYGDYLIDPDKEMADSFMGTHLLFGGDTFKTWEEIIEYFSRLGGQ
ncbi:MAG: esterase [Prevotella sp.]|nr:esterase [Prevotella sp.]